MRLVWPRLLRRAALGALVIGLTLGALAACHTLIAPASRRFPGDIETLRRITLTSPGAGDVLIWSEDPSAPGGARYLPRPAADYPLETRTLGCISCHVGQKEPHADDLSFNLERAIGCTDCHGGVGWVTTRSAAALAPELKRFLGEVLGQEPSEEELSARLARFTQVASDDEARRAAHVHEPAPANRALWSRRRGGAELSSGNPEAAFAAALADSWEWVRFVNPGDLRVASISCGTAGCHGAVEPQRGGDLVLKVQKSMMTTGPMLWGAALYNNGAYPEKAARFGESYGPHGEVQRVLGQLPEDPHARAEARLGRGELEALDPLPRFEVGQPANVLRVFERGQRRPIGIGLPEPGTPGGPLLEEPGRPSNRLSQRGLGTLNRTDPVWLNLQRTRLMDPTLNMMGTNDQPGDYRASGCTACHMVYANDRDPLNALRAGSWGERAEDRRYAPFAHHMGPYRYGEEEQGGIRVEVPGGRDAGDLDSTLPADEPGHPIRHELTVRIPSTQCVVCHMHPGTAVENSYLGYMWWDLETDAHALWPREQVRPSPELELAATTHNPEGSTAKRIPPLPADLDPATRARLLAEAGSEEAARELYYRREQLGEVVGSPELNARLDNMQLGDFKGHGFLFRAVWSRDAEGELLRARGEVMVETPEGPLWVIAGEAAPLAEGAAPDPSRLRLVVEGQERTVELPPALQAELEGAAPGARVTLLCRREGPRAIAQERVVDLVWGRLLAPEGAAAAASTSPAAEQAELPAVPADAAALRVQRPGGEVVECALPPPGEGLDGLRRAALLARLGGLRPGAEVILLTEGAAAGHAIRHAATQRLTLEPGDPDWEERWRLGVHLQDVHLERGMHCVDCHFSVDNHGDGKLYGELRAATAIKCEDCHGTIDALASLRTSGNAGGQDLTALKVRGAGGSPIARFEWRYPARLDKRSGEWQWKDWDPTKERTAYRAPEAKLFQRSLLYPDLEWEVPQVLHSIDPEQDALSAEGKVSYRGRSRYNPLAAVAKTVRTDGSWGRAPRRRWGGPEVACEREPMAHGPAMECYACHTSWMTSCFGCHLDMKANWRRPALHNEGLLPARKSPFLSAGPTATPPFAKGHPEEHQRNWASYSFQTLRTDFFMLGRDGDVSGGKVVPVRSACAVTVGSQNQNRENVYSQQQTVSAEGFSGTAFSPHFPHTVRATETRSCADCHVSQADDNNARLAQALLLGSNAVNFVGRYAYVAAGAGGFDAVVVTEKGEPQAVIGSVLHGAAWPEEHAAHEARERRLLEGYHHTANTVLGVSVPFGDDEVRSVQLRGEYLYTANGPGGLRVYDVAQIDQKGFSARIVSAPVSPLGQWLAVDTEDATAVRAPSTLAVDPTRNPDRLDRPQNREQKVHPLYGYLYVTDRVEGLILVGAATLLDGDPANNFLERAVTFNPDGLLTGAQDCVVAGRHVYVACDAGVVVVDVDQPLAPRVVARSAPGAVVGPRGLEVQLRYAFVADREGVKVLDVTALLLGEAPPEGEEHVLPLAGSFVDPARLPEARAITVSRAYGYVAAGPAGLVVLDLTRPRQPTFVLGDDLGGRLSANDVEIGATNASLYAYVASGSAGEDEAEDGLFVFQLTGNVTPEDPYASGRALGSNPRPDPRWIAFYPTSAPALAVSDGVDRDRAVDESGNQQAVFGRIGSRPFTHEEMKRLLTLTTGDQAGQPFAVPVLRDRPAHLSDEERLLRRAEIEEAFSRSPFRKLEPTEDEPAVAWPEREKKGKKKR